MGQSYIQNKVRIQAVVTLMTKVTANQGHCHDCCLEIKDLTAAKKYKSYHRQAQRGDCLTLSSSLSFLLLKIHALALSLMLFVVVVVVLVKIIVKEVLAW